MAFINIELKARTTRTAEIRAFLVAHGAELRGTDHQVDTYFKVPEGRLKLREGNIENNLIYYRRVETGTIKQSDVELVKTAPGSGLKALLAKALGVKAVVDKNREIYYIGNIKFHLDTLEDLGSFVEIEASNQFEAIPAERLQQQCKEYMQAFGIREDDVVSGSYSDMVGA